MKKLINLLAAFAALCGTSQAQTQPTSSLYQPGKLYVYCNNPADIPTFDASGNVQTQNTTIRQVFQQYHVKSMVKTTPGGLTERTQNTYIINCDCQAEQLLSSLNGNVASYKDMEQVPIYWTLGVPPNDYANNDMTYALDLMHALDAWDITKGSPNIIIGISDDGVDTNDLELVNKIDYVRPGILNATHGTTVSKCAAGETNNGYGASSIGYKCRLYNTVMTIDDAFELSKKGAKVVNCSWGTFVADGHIQDIARDIWLNGTLLVAAAGNGLYGSYNGNGEYKWEYACVNANGQDTVWLKDGCNETTNFYVPDPNSFTSSKIKLIAQTSQNCVGSSTCYFYPASFEHVMSVAGSIENDFTPLHRSQGMVLTKNDKVDVTAPYGNSGSSFAAPMAAGLAGLIFSLNPNFRPEQVEHIIKITADPTIYDKNPQVPLGHLGTGRIDAHKAVKLASKLAGNPLKASISNPCAVAGDALTLTASGGTLPYKYQWSTGETTTTLSNILAGVLTVTITDADSGYIILYRAIPTSPFTASIDGSNASGCAGQVTLVANLGFSYKWSTGGTEQYIRPTASGNYSVTVSDINGCTAVASATATVYALPVANAGVNKTIIQGNSTTLNGSASGGTLPYTYAWYPSTGGTVPNVASPTVNPIETTTYVFQVMDANGCFSLPDDVVITVIPTICSHTYVNTIGTFGEIDTIDAGGGTITYNGTYRIISSIVLRNGTFNMAPGSIFYIDGYKISGGRYNNNQALALAERNSNNTFYRNANTQNELAGGNIYLNNATLNINGAVLQASCDTMWGGIKHLWTPASFSDAYNVLRISKSGNRPSYIRDAVMPVHTGAYNSQNNPNVPPGYKWGIHGYMNGVKFENCYLPVTSGSPDGLYYAAIVDTITNSSINCNPDAMKWPYNKTSSFNKYYTHIGINLLHTQARNKAYIASDTINNVLRGISQYIAGDEVFDGQIYNCVFNNNLLAAYYTTTNVGGTDSAIFVGNTINFPTQAVNSVQIPASSVGKSTGVVGFITDKSRFNNNIFNGSINNTGLMQQGMVLVEMNSANAYSLNGNTFAYLSNSVNTLNQHSLNVSYIGNTFTSIQNAITIANNQTGVAPSIFIHCNDFTKGSAASPAIAINIPGPPNAGKTGNIGACFSGFTAGNKFVGYNTGLNFGVFNASGNDPFDYYRSTNEQAGINFGNVSPNVGIPFCGAPSGCTAIGQGLIALLHPPPLLTEVLLAVERLRRNILVLPGQYQPLISTVIRYYEGTCGTGNKYLNTVNQMLPKNLRAYTDLAFSLSDCYIAGRQFTDATNLLQQVLNYNPGNGFIRERVQYTTAMLNIGQSKGNPAPADINTLMQIANTGGEYNVAACIALMGLKRDWASNCISTPPQGGHRTTAMADELQAGNEKAAFANAPNPFSESTVVAYQLAGDVKTAILKVYDIQGRLVRSQPLDVQAGETTVYAAGLFDGVYIYTIACDGTEALDKKRMVIIR